MDLSRYLRAVLLVGVGLLPAACGPEYQRAGHAPYAVIPPRAQWSLRGTFEDMHLLKDGDEATVAHAPAGEPALLDIDLGREGRFNLVLLHHGQRETGFPSRVLVSTSMDGQTWTPRAMAAGTRRITMVSLVAPASARWIRLQAQGGEEPIMIAEIYLQ